MIITIQILYLHFNHSVDHKYQLTAFLSSLVNTITSLIDFLLHEELDFMKEFFISHFQPLFEVVDFFQQFDFEINPFVIIAFANAVFHDVIEIGIVIPKVVKLLLGQLRENTVIHTLDCSCARTIKYETNLTKVVARLYISLLDIFTHVIGD